MKLIEKIQSISLDTYNFYAFLLHLISAIVVIIVFSVLKGEIGYNTTLYAYRIDTLENDGKDVTFTYGDDGPHIEVSGISLKTLVGVIFFLTAMFHLYYLKSKFYKREVKSGKNRIRWLEYGITSTIMIFVLCIVAGVKDLYSTLLLTLFNLVLMSFGYFLEMTPGYSPKLTAVIMGFFVLVVIFSVIYAQFIQNLIQVQKDDYEIPSWVYGVMFPMVLWWASFGIVGVLYLRAYKKGKLNFERYEKYYILLSYLSKAFMGYYLIFGLTRDPPERSS